ELLVERRADRVAEVDLAHKATSMRTRRTCCTRRRRNFAHVTGARSAAMRLLLRLEDEEDGMLEERAQPLEEARSLGPVHDAMVARERHVHRVPRDELAALV